MFYKVQSVRPLPDYRLQVRFLNGETKRYDVKPLFDEWDAFKALTRITGLFEQVHVDAHGYGIAWNDEIDLDCNTVYEGGIADDAWAIETDLTADEKAIIEEGRKHYEAHPEDFVPLESIL